VTESPGQAPRDGHLRSGSNATIIDIHAHPTLRAWEHAYDVAGHERTSGRPVWGGAVAPEFRIARWLEAMDAAQVQARLLSNPHGADIFAGEVQRELARAMNEEMAAVVAGNPARFGALATLPLDNIDAAIAELRYAMGDLGLDGVLLPTAIGGDFLSHPRFEPLLAACESLHAPVLIHPTATRAQNGFEPLLLEQAFETTRCLASLVYGGFRRRLPHIVLIGAYGGGAVPYLAYRFSTFAGSRNVGDLSEDEVWAGLTSLHFDLTATTGDAALASVLRFTTARQLMFGNDAPHESEASARSAIHAVATSHLLSPAARDDILSVTALAVFPRLAQRIRAAAANMEQDR